MFGLSHATASALSGLTTSSARANIASLNIANATSPGYTRQSLTTSTTYDGLIRIEGALRATAPNLTADRRQADSEAGYASVLAGALDRLTTAMGDPDQEASLFNDYARLEESIRELADTPESVPLQNGVVSAGKTLINSFERVQKQITDVRNDAEKEIAVQVDRVNTALHTIHDLNEKIVTIEISGENANSLREERDRQLDAIASIVPIRIYERDNGHTAITTDAGISLLEGTVRELEFTPITLVGSDTDYRGGVGALSGVSVNGVDITPQGTSNQTLTTGSLAALFEVRDGEGFAAQEQLDSLALDLVERFADPAVEPGLAAGQAGLFGDNGDTYDPLNVSGLASRLTINTAVDPNAGGDLWRIRDGITAAAEGPVGEDDHVRDLLSALTDLRAVPAATGLTGSKSASQLVADISSFRATKSETALLDTSIKNNKQIVLADAELGETGVDMDQELQSLQRIENAYGANARVLQTVNAMLRRILEI